jgi:hypothetical protein
MLAAYIVEQSSPNPYRSKILTPHGHQVFASAMRSAIAQGTEVSLVSQLLDPALWIEREPDRIDGRRGSKITPEKAAERLALSEFNTWYVAGLSRRLQAEGETHCQIYRAAEPKWKPADCEQHEGMTYAVVDIISGHRLKYWPTEQNEAFSIPSSPGCHHSIRRV